MPRPPARRTRTVRQARGGVPKNTAQKKDANESSRVTTPRRAGSDDAQRGSKQPALQPDLTPTGNPNENALASSPAENTTTTSIRPPTRARGYSSTLSLVGRKGDFNSRIGNTPGFEVSILSNFKRRTRQPSLLQMMQADDDDESDLDNDDFLGGLSSPQDESTPLNVARAPTVDNQLAVSPSRPPVVTSPLSRESRKRKCQPASDHIDQDSAPGSRSSSLSAITRTPGTPSIRRSVDLQSITMATPLSSITASPAQLLLVGHRKQKTVSDGADSLPKVTTLNIRAKLLPQRRIRRRQQADDSEDADSAHEDTDEDELTREVMRRPLRPRKKALSNAASRNANAKMEKSKRGSRKNKGDTEGGPQSKAQRTYSRQKPQASDKENYVFDDDSSALSSPPASEDLESESEIPSHNSKKRIISRELQQAALKFAEVDKWEMEFEEVSFSENSPSR